MNDRENKTVSVGVRLTPRDKDKLKQLCEIKQASISTVIRMLIDQEFKKEKR